MKVQYMQVKLFETNTENGICLFSYHKVFWQDPSHQTSFCYLSYLFHGHHDLFTEKRIELLRTPNTLRERCLADTIFVLRDGRNFRLDEIYEILCDNIVKGDRKMEK